jgi:hypothetical protein
VVKYLYRIAYLYYKMAKYKCESCNVEFKTEKELKEHLEREHKEHREHRHEHSGIHCC